MKAEDFHGPESGRTEPPLERVEVLRREERVPQPDLPEELRHLDERERAQGLSLRRLFAEQEHGLRQKYADWIIWLLGVQMLGTDVIFVVYAWAGRGWELLPGVIEVWLGATVVQVVGVVIVVTRHLFPSRDGGEAAA